VKKKYSLKGRNCFQAVYKEGIRIRQKNSTFFILKKCSKEKSKYCRKTEDIIKLGIVAPKKIGNAVLRNRAKRKFREAFSKFLEDDIHSNCIIVRLYNGFTDMTIDEVTKEIDSCLRKIR
jgi:ribonuclease P protein component